MDRDQIQTFITSAEADLEAVRRSLLFVAQAGVSETRPLAELRRVQTGATEHSLSEIAALSAECEAVLTADPSAAMAALDLIARIEAALFQVRSDDESSVADIEELFAASLGEKNTGIVENEVVEEFEIDDETLEIFRAEAEELLTNITREMFVLSDKPGDQKSLWSIRRNAHTFKGSAAIVGLRDASLIAHRMEDLLDKLVETGGEAVPDVYSFLIASLQSLEAVIAHREVPHDETFLNEAYGTAMNCLSSLPKKASLSDPPAETNVSVPAPAKTTPIVRVSLDRLDELIRLSQNFKANQMSLAAALASGVSLESLVGTQKALADEMHAKLLRIRLVKFGTLETRLARVVNATCVDENKKAGTVVEGGDVEIDTQVIDALIEPLLHLIKNAVVHGIEPPDVRRMLGKPERGTIRVSLASEPDEFTLAVSDDGSGISAAKLKARALEAGIIDDHVAETIHDTDATNLIFERGLTTAARVDLNAGRGVGMSIVKEAVEARSGTISVESQPHIGTTFTIQIPVGSPRVSKGSTLPIAGFGERLVLIVDDSASIRRHNTKLAEEAGMRVITAGNGAEALELLLSGAYEPNLILSDIEMPQIDGWEFLEYIKTDKNFGHIPVVMVTSLDADEHRTRASALGAADYLIKPLTADSFATITSLVACSA